MIPVKDSSGQIIGNLFRNDDGSLSVIDHEGLNNNILSKNIVNKLIVEVDELKDKIKIIFERLNF